MQRNCITSEGGELKSLTITILLQLSQKPTPVILSTWKKVGSIPAATCLNCNISVPVTKSKYDATFKIKSLVENNSVSANCLIWRKKCYTTNALRYDKPMIGSATVSRSYISIAPTVTRSKRPSADSCENEILFGWRHCGVRGMMIWICGCVKIRKTVWVPCNSENEWVVKLFCLGHLFHGNFPTIEIHW